MIPSILLRAVYPKQKAPALLGDLSLFELLVLVSALHLNGGIFYPDVAAKPAVSGLFAD